MVDQFEGGTSNEEVTIEMLDSIVHTPAVVVRKL
jgi:F420-0:gamma-glutamyl ligase-like protein